MRIPIYQKIEKDIKIKINSKELQSGEMIPSENELKDFYNVSRMTVRHALNNLVNDGYLYRHKGKGTFVSSGKIEKNIHGVRGFTEEMTAIGKVVTNKIISFEVIQTNDFLREKLFLEGTDSVYHVERIRYADDIPVLHEDLYIPTNIFQDLTQEDFLVSFYNYVENKKFLKISHSIQSIEAKLSSKILQNSLDVEPNSPILSITRNTFLTNGRPFEYVVSNYRSDQYRFVQHAVKT